MLHVRDIERSVSFYSVLLGFRTVFRLHADGSGTPEAAFLRAEGPTNDHDLAFLQMDDPAATVPPPQR
ncbi:catechol 2,3-dioxygenase-like lactoylglutathione lyase family enzyme [Streptomyces sp. HB132]|nr:catechol 2,3-dioxygenase-like lactoylglutathione lyase family enzyme [Streptomyces sp. HB132]